MKCKIFVIMSTVVAITSPTITMDGDHLFELLTIVEGIKQNSKLSIRCYRLAEKLAYSESYLQKFCSTQSAKKADIRGILYLSGQLKEIYKLQTKEPQDWKKANHECGAIDYKIKMVIKQLRSESLSEKELAVNMDWDD